MNDVVLPRLIYKGPADDSAETRSVADADALADALKAGWRLKRVPVASSEADADAGAKKHAAAKK